MTAIPALLPTSGVWPHAREGESELLIRAEFVDVFPLGLMSIVIAHLHWTVRGERTSGNFFKSVPILLRVGGLSDEKKENMTVEFVRKQRTILGTVRALKGVALTDMQRCLKAFEECSNDPVRPMRVRRKHYLMMDCRQELMVCGKKGGIEFELEHEWIRNETTKQLENLESKCNCGLECDFNDRQHAASQSVVRTVIRKLPRAPDDVVVFISHARERKEGVAHPLRESLGDAGLLGFLDVNDLHAQPETVHEQLIATLRDCTVAVFIPSSECVPKKWPMLELREILRVKRKAREDGRPKPTLFPLFFALTVKECKNGRLLAEGYAKLFERRNVRTCARTDNLGKRREK